MGGAEVEYKSPVRFQCITPPDGITRQERLAWSPDGKRIVFSSGRDDCRYSDAEGCKTTGDIGPYQSLDVMQADGSDQNRLTDIFGQFADWSPDGPSGLQVIAADGSGLTTLPTGLGYCAFPDRNP